MKAPRPLRDALAALAGAALALMLALASDGLRDRPGRADVGVVPGHRVERDGRPSRRLASRLERALGLWREGAFPVLVVSGGREREGWDEATVMRGWLVAHGMPADRIVVDSSGRTTWWTARFMRAWMPAHGARTACVVTQYFHVPRTRLALARAGVTVTAWSHARFWDWRDPYATFREVVAYAWYAVRRS